jgi:hypothetical protein
MNLVAKAWAEIGAEANPLGEWIARRLYRSQVASYVVAALSNRAGDLFDLELVWAKQSASPELEFVMRRWSQSVLSAIVEGAGSRNVTEWCKKADCWRLVQEHELQWPEKMPPELERASKQGGGWGVQATEVRRSIDPEELDAQRQCRISRPRTGSGSSSGPTRPAAWSRVSAMSPPTWPASRQRAGPRN